MTARRVPAAATVVVAAGLPALLADLARRGVGRLLVEGGTAVHTTFLASGLADELSLAIAPILVGGGTRFVDPAVFPAGAPAAAGRAGRRRHGRAALRTCLRMTDWLRAAIELSRRCEPSPYAYSVGAIIVSADGTELARGYSRETEASVHAEEVALLRVKIDDLVDAVLYSSLEPCGVRRSRPAPCAG